MRAKSSVAGICAVSLLFASGCFLKPDAPAAGNDGGVDSNPSVDAMPDAALPPEMPIDPRGPQRLAAGGQHVCSIDNAGSLTCWGRNLDGELGLPSADTQNAPVRVGDTGGWTSVAAGLSHTCGIRNGTVLCWGRNASNQAGGSGQNTLSPTPVALPAGFQASTMFADDDLSCAVGSQGSDARTYCWGEISSGGSNADITSPPATTMSAFQIGSLVANPAGSRWSKVVAGASHRCALRDTGAVFCWGGNDAGQTGRPRSSEAVLPADAQELSAVLKFIDIAAGTHTTCGITTSNDIYCWGEGENIVPIRATSSHQPMLIAGTSGRVPRTVSIGFYHACVSYVDGGVGCWGQDANGAMGFANRYFEGLLPTRASPLPINLQPGAVAPAVVSLVAAEYFTCARVATGQPVRCWGSNDYAQLGLGIRAQRSTLATPALELPIGGKVASMVAGNAHVCSRILNPANGLTTDSCWGRNFESQVDSLPPATDDKVMYVVPGISTVQSAAIVAGGSNTCHAVSVGGALTRLTCWGDNGSNQLGTSDVATVFDTDAPSGSSWVGAATNGGATCGLLRNDTLLGVEAECWGQRFNTNTANATHYKITTDLAPTVTWEKIALGSDFGIALVNIGVSRKIVTWGADTNGQLGGGIADPTKARSVLNVPSNATEVSLAAAGADGHHACVAWQDPPNPPTIKCWGHNNQGQAGRPYNNIEIAPITDVTLPGGVAARSIVAAADHTCALTAEAVGRVYCWGAPEEMGMQGNQISLGNTPRLFAASSDNWTLLATGRHHTCAASTGTATVPARVHCWGTSEFGQLGDGSRYHPDPVAAMVPR